MFRRGLVGVVMLMVWWDGSNDMALAVIIKCECERERIREGVLGRKKGRMGHNNIFNRVGLAELQLDD